jgi:hypothetical protein
MTMDTTPHVDLTVFPFRRVGEWLLRLTRQKNAREAMDEEDATLLLAIASAALRVVDYWDQEEHPPSDLTTAVVFLKDDLLRALDRPAAPAADRGPWNDPGRLWNEQAWGRPVSGIPFTQRLRQDDRQVPKWVDRSPEIEAIARELVEAGVAFVVKELASWARVGARVVSMAAELDGDVIAREECPNGPEVPDAVDRLILAAKARLDTRRSS